jgi:hypothetical protein
MSRHIIVHHEELELIVKRLHCIVEAVRISQKILEYLFRESGVSADHECEQANRTRMAKSKHHNFFTIRFQNLVYHG